jgi:hypothetical protein
MKPLITHYGLYRQQVPNSPMIKEALFFEQQGGLKDPWGGAWEPIYNAASVGDARRKFAASKGVELSHIYFGEE